MNNNKRRNLPNWDADKFTLMMQTHQQLAQMAHEKFPDTIVIPTFGNNDFDLDDEPANETQKREFYSEIFRYWFHDNPANVKVMNLNEIWRTFLNGGYYRVDVDPKLSVLALNTVMYLFKNRGIPY